MNKKQHIRFLILCTLLCSATLLYAQNKIYLVKGGPDTGKFTGGVFIGLGSKINHHPNETNVLIDEKPGILEGSWKDVTGITQSGTTLTKTATDGWR